MVGINVIAEQGVSYSEYKKNDKHRIYFKMEQSGGKPIEVGNYDLQEGSYFPARGSNGENTWGVVGENDNAQALIVIGDAKKVFVGPRKKNATNNTWNAKKSYGGGAPSNRDKDIKMGMCQNNAALMVAQMNPLEKGMSNEEIADLIKDLKVAIFEANCA
jgi:hypothetical protein